MSLCISGRPCGWVTSSAYSFTEHAHICWVLLHDVIISEADSFYVRIAEKDTPASLRYPYNNMINDNQYIKTKERIIQEQ